MSNNELICKMKDYIQPFERQLALMELKSVTGVSPTPEPNLSDQPTIYRVKTPRKLGRLCDTLAYWEVIRPPDSDGQYTRQVRSEATVSIARNGVSLDSMSKLLPFNGGLVPVPNRRTLRYGSHGIHEYRGKFFPQLVRALLNISGVERGSIILDPMCGSGTTLVEGAVLGCNVLGSDLNPLSILMSRAKCGILTTSVEKLRGEYESLRTDLVKPTRHGTKLPWLQHLPERDRDYLATWFDHSTLAELDRIAQRISEVDDTTCRDLFRICLSSILRRVSWQKEADLRVRRKAQLDNTVSALNQFVEELDRSVRTILAFIFENHQCVPGAVQIIEGDARSLARHGAPFSRHQGKVDAIVTSPPYATALPYLDTDRLSLCYLGLLPRSAHRSRDYDMIGNREVNEVIKRAYWAEYEENRNELPDQVTLLIDRISQLNEHSNVGFRRRNLPVLLARYFLDMRQVFRTIATFLRPGGFAYVVIGNNHTLAGGCNVEIETDRHLGSIGQAVGLNLVQTISMEMLVSRDIFKRNSVSSETILCFQK